MADTAQDKVEEFKETGALYKTKMVDDFKMNPSTILEDAGKKLEGAKEASEDMVDATKEKLQVAKGAMEEKVEEVKEKMAPEKEDGSEDDSE